VEVLTGCELSAHHGGRPVHVLGYFFDPDHPVLAEELRLIRDSRVRRAEMMVDQLRKLGVPVTYARVREIAQGDSVGRPHIAQAMVEAGVIRRTDEAFTDAWIGNRGRAYVEKRSPSPPQAVRLIVEAGGAAVVAHPVWLTNDLPDWMAVIEDMVEAGLAGVEVDHPDQDAQARARYRSLAQRLGLVATGSSDWHGNEHGGVIGSNTTTPEALEALVARARGAVRR
jgi:predicted metal-dependent phosphoesterase TrpH